MVRIKRLLINGELKDSHSLKLISCLLIWAEFNNISLNSGLELMEYSHHHDGRIESSYENNLFLEMFKQYTSRQWLDLALGKEKILPKIKLKNQISFDFHVESDHFKMHYLEMLKLTQIYFNNESFIEKFKCFHKWIYDNILICNYTTYFAVLAIGNKSKLFQNQSYEYDLIIKKCINQAWDLSYLSLWSTYHYHEDSSEEIYLFATMDKELKELFFLTHRESNEIYINCFGKKEGYKIIECISEIYKPRKNNKDNLPDLDIMIDEEERLLKSVLSDLK